jgi:mono/diheme cytochrome c family protein
VSLDSFPRPIFGLRAIRLATRITLGATLLVASAIFLLYGISEWQLRRTYDAPLVALRVPVDPARAGEGERMSHTFGCSGCHQAAGNVLAEIPNVVHLVAPNLTRVARGYTDAELVRLIRHGVKRDGTSVITMPAATFNAMSDADVATIIAWLRSLPQVADAPGIGKTTIGPLGRVAIVAGKVPFGAAAVRALPPPLTRPVSTPSDHGEYLVKSICRHCHDLDAEHDDGWGTVAPALRMMGQAYPFEDFRHLLRTGRAMGDRDVGLMSIVAREDFSHMTDPEIEAIHAFLNDLEKAPAETE